MNRQLLLLRHAKSSWDTLARTDFERPLAKRGLHDAPRVGQYLAEQGLAPDFVTSSPAERARQTVTLACSELGIHESQIHWDERIYHASTRDLVAVLRATPPTARCVLMTGHNPGFEDLLQWLTGGVPVPADGKLMPTAALAHLQLEAPWQALERGTARLRELVRARSL